MCMYAHIFTRYVYRSTYRYRNSFMHLYTNTHIRVYQLVGAIVSEYPCICMYAILFKYIHIYVHLFIYTHTQAYSNVVDAITLVILAV